MAVQPVRVVTEGFVYCIRESSCHVPRGGAIQLPTPYIYPPILIPKFAISVLECQSPLLDLLRTSKIIKFNPAIVAEWKYENVKVEIWWIINHCLCRRSRETKSSLIPKRTEHHSLIRSWDSKPLSYSRFKAPAAPFKYERAYVWVGG